MLWTCEQMNLDSIENSIIVVGQSASHMRHVFVIVGIHSPPAQQDVFLLA